MKHDPLSDALVLIKNADHVGKESAIVPASRLIGDVLKLLTEKGYLNNYEFRDDGRGGEYDISLNGRINGCGAIKPRFSIKLKDMDRHEARYLPAKDFGLLILTTPYGVMNNDQAKEASTGGKLLAYVY
ncbi:MAG: 30S ribosomal protein S8 [Marine Group III euryarchaeote CG-Epi2]|uniref:30S ribosomal protein S8 n=1 Tax=Marine Group III euryarchaeote CG-Epi2 TaxID=1888996 RepID=A0A1J5U0Y9_9ARCH|nr:MAG: 30S ribosomal protein S8 [Marine Group III euryarchaeote CG-Epi2]OIR22421.1 MAG: 30S ribosomal protein S8 [Marine Group III euryarchaeote CG-Epi2]